VSQADLVSKSGCFLRANDRRHAKVVSIDERETLVDNRAMFRDYTKISIDFDMRYIFSEFIRILNEQSSEIASIKSDYSLKDANETSLLRTLCLKNSVHISHLVCIEKLREGNDGSIERNVKIGRHPGT